MILLINGLLVLKYDTHVIAYLKLYAKYFLYKVTFFELFDKITL
jgi:hypothetical protein